MKTCFCNIKIFQEDIENSIRKDTRVVIVDASAINSIDVTAADRLDAISASLKKRGIRFYLTEHSTQINDQLRQFGIGHMIKDGMVRRTILAALHDAGIEAPYELDVPKEDETKLLRRSIAFLPAEEENTLEEFAWAFGDDAVKEIEESVHHIIEQLHQIRISNVSPKKVWKSFWITGMGWVFWMRMNCFEELNYIWMSCLRN